MEALLGFAIVSVLAGYSNCGKMNLDQNFDNELSSDKSLIRAVWNWRTDDKDSILPFNNCSFGIFYGACLI